MGAGATLVSTGDRISNDIRMKCGVLGAYNLPIVEWTRQVITDTPKPGHVLQHPTGAAGEDTVCLHDVKNPNPMYFAEFDPGLIATTATAYASTDEIPIIPLFLNPGAICRNIQCDDPAADVEPGNALAASPTTTGLLQQVVEATLKSSSGTVYGYQVTTLGTNAAAGTFILSRIAAVQMYFLTDPSAAYTDVVSIVWCR